MPKISFPNPFYSSSSITAKKPTPATVLFQDYYKQWFKTLKSTLLPLIHRSLSDPSPPALLSSHVQLLLHHFLSYYDALDLAATVSAADNLPHLLHPSWRNPLELPFLFLGDLHPYLLTNLLRKFLSEADDDNTEQLGLGMAWKDPSDRLTVKIEQIERGLRLIVPSFSERMKKAQSEFMRKIGAAEEKSEAVVREAMKAEMDEMVSIFVDANRLRRSVISEIVGSLDLYQGALFLEGLTLFLVGFREPALVRKFKRHRIETDNDDGAAGGFVDARGDLV
ncbi:Protein INAPERTURATE POLLEN1 [Linum grandiflorum]